MTNFKKTFFLILCLIAGILTSAQTNKNYFVYNKIIKNNNDLSIVLRKDNVSQLYLLYTKQDSVASIKLKSCFILPLFDKYPISWNIDKENVFVILTLSRQSLGFAFIKRAQLEKGPNGMNDNIHVDAGKTIFPLTDLYSNWEQLRMRKHFTEYYNQLYFGLVPTDLYEYLLYMTKKDTIVEYKRTPATYFNSTKTLSQNFNGVFQALRQNTATYLLTDSVVYKVKQDTLLPTGKIIKKSVEDHADISHFFIDDKDNEEILLFPPYYFVKEHEEAPKIRTLNEDDELYNLTMKMANKYFRKEDD